MYKISYPLRIFKTGIRSIKMYIIFCAIGTYFVIAVATDFSAAYQTFAFAFFSFKNFFSAFIATVFISEKTKLPVAENTVMRKQNINNHIKKRDISVHF